MSTSTRSGSLDLVEIRESDALKTLARDLLSTLDLVLVDEAKGAICTFSIESRASAAGSLVIAEDVHHCPTSFGEFALISNLLEHRLELEEASTASDRRALSVDKYVRE